MGTIEKITHLITELFLTCFTVDILSFVIVFHLFSSVLFCIYNLPIFYSSALPDKQFLGSSSQGTGQSLHDVHLERSSHNGLRLTLRLSLGLPKTSN